MTTTTTTTETNEAPTKLNREALETMGAELGWDAERIAETWDRMQAALAREERIEAAGLKVSYRKHLLRVSNVRFHYGRMQDGTCHYQHQTTVAGSTYPVKDALKAAGYRWDATDKLWARPMSTKGASIHDHLEEAKDLVDGIVG